MTDHGRYGDDRTFALPDGWAPLRDEVLATATDQTLAAVTGTKAVESLVRYYDRNGSYAGTLFLDAQPNDPNAVEASDLYAVTTLSIKLDARQGRLLLDEGDVREQVKRHLRNLDPCLPITDLTHGEGGSAETLARMYELHGQFRSLLAGASNRWVTAAKLCARKRPRLFPVRDNLVCEYLGAGRSLKSGDGWPGDFSIDIQVYGHLMTNPKIVAALSWLREELTATYGLRVDVEDLRLLDSALWMAARRHLRS
ncbi:DUF6308 family protein [Nocardioides ungokensis]|uniref:DUF6308 family protein n=1 Tax=Nocardioides ungokensis TaxID=1643322 RepID=UPI0015E03EAC|nr:DUF6308 family protein [Nocardioides ungokensis]